MPYLQQQQGQITRPNSGGQAILANGQGVSQIQGHLLSQLQHGAAVAQVHRDSNISKIPQFPNHGVQSQLRGQVDSRNFGLAQAGQQAFSNQMQPPGTLHLSGSSQAPSGNSTPSNGMLPGQLQAQMMTSQGLHLQASSQVLSGGAGGNAHSVPGSQVHLQALSQLPGQSTLSGRAASPNFIQPSQQMIPAQLPKQPTLPQPTGQILSQPHSLNQAVVNGGQQSLPGTPQSEISDLRSTA